MNLPPDFLDLLAEFDAADVRYLVIGGYAVGYHDRPRTTKDLDLLLDASSGNVDRACRALEQFGAPASIVADLAAASSDEIVWLGVPPVRIDLLKAAPGITFDEAYPRRSTEVWNGVRVDIVGLRDLISSKRAAGREQDLVDATRLERLGEP